MSKPDTDSDGIAVAKYVKYWRQFTNSFVRSPIDYKRIEALGFYRENQALFDKAAKIFKKYEFDVSSYVKFLVKERLMTQYSVKSQLLDMQNIRAFIESKQIRAHKKKVYKYFMKSVDFVSDEAAKLGYITTIDYLRMLIRKRKLASYYVSGKISAFFLAAIPKFPKIVEKLDSISKDEFQPLCLKYEKYNVDVRESLKLIHGKVVGVLSFTDQQISKKREKLMSEMYEIDVP